MSIDRDDLRLSFVSLEELTTPIDGAVVRKDYWWAVCPERGAIFFQRYTPQSNRNEAFSRKITSLTYPWAEVRLIPLAFIPTRHQDHRL